MLRIPEATALVVALAAIAPPSHADGIAIDHSSPACMIAGRFPVLNARLDPAASVARARIAFRADGDDHWYFVEMKAKKPVFEGTLPQPLKETGKVHYYIEATDKTLQESRTEEYISLVVDGPGVCSDPKRVAGVVASAAVKVQTAAGAPSLPAGFSAAGVTTAAAGAAVAAGAGAATAGGGLSAGAVVGIVAGGAAVAGGIVAATHSNSSSPTTTLAPSLTGTWVGTETLTATSNIPGSNCPAVHWSYTLTLVQAGTSLSGGDHTVVTSTDGPCGNNQPNLSVGAVSNHALTGGSLDGANIMFTLNGNDPGVKATFVGTVSGDSMSGSSSWSGATNDPSLRIHGIWNATRQ
jgi:hypothetical protein